MADQGSENAALEAVETLERAQSRATATRGSGKVRSQLHSLPEILPGGVRGLIIREEDFLLHWYLSSLMSEYCKTRRWDVWHEHQQQGYHSCLDLEQLAVPCMLNSDNPYRMRHQWYHTYSNTHLMLLMQSCCLPGNLVLHMLFMYLCTFCCDNVGQSMN